MDQLSTDKDILKTILKVLGNAKTRQYRGWDKHDGMNSKIIEYLPFRSKWVNLVLQELVKRSPLNIRPLLLIQKKRSFKGISLFSLTYFNLYDLTQERAYLQEGIGLVDWLVNNSSKGYSGFCGGHRHPRQQVDRFVPPNTPASVPTYFAVQALLEAYRRSGERKYLDTAKSSKDFLVNDLGYKENASFATIKYKPGDKEGSYTLNANALGARMLLQLYHFTKEEELIRKAEKIINFVCSKQTDIGGWMYTDPPSSSHLAMDNYHNGFIIEAILDFKEITGSDTFDDNLNEASSFYRKILFNEDGSPNWDNIRAYPKDIHACAEGIILFARENDFDYSNRILNWTIRNLYDDRGFFYYQKLRNYTKKVMLMRWGQAWMCFALSGYLKAVRDYQISNKLEAVKGGQNFIK